MKSKFRVGQKVIVHRRYNGEKFEATLTKLLYNGAATGPCWAMTRETAEYEEYLSPIKKKRPNRGRKKGER